MFKRICLPLGPTADRCMSESLFADFARITGVPLDLITRFKIMLDAVSCGEPVDPQKFKSAADAWLDKFHGDPNISWHWLNVLLHMFFQHGHQIIEELPVAAGLCAEQGSEHANKVVCNDREHHSRQSNVGKNLADVFNRRHYSADPKISAILCKKLMKNHNKKNLSKEVLELLANPQPPITHPDTESHWYVMN